MGELEYEKDIHQWAWEKGHKRKCMKHGIDYDPHIGCPKCLEEQREREEKEREEKKRKTKAIFDSVIWPDK